MPQYKIEWNKINSIKEIVDFIRRQLGGPIVKVEMTDQQILDNINLALDLFLMYAIGVASEEQYYALMLKGGVTEYQLDEGIIDILDFTEYGIYSSGINTLFTLQNQMSMAGMLDFNMQGENTMLLLNYHLVLDFIETVQRYSSTLYQGSYDSFERVLSITPEPKHEIKPIYNANISETSTVDSPGGVMVKVKQFIGAGRPNGSLDNALRKIFSHIGIKYYALALCKINLGMIRRKFNQYASIGNTGIALDGSDLMSEGLQAKADLEKQLIEDQLGAGVGYGITTGQV